MVQGKTLLLWWPELKRLLCSGAAGLPSLSQHTSYIEPLPTNPTLYRNHSVAKPSKRSRCGWGARALKRLASAVASYTKQHQEQSGGKNHTERASGRGSKQAKSETDRSNHTEEKGKSQPQ